MVYHPRQSVSTVHGAQKMGYFHSIGLFPSSENEALRRRAELKMRACELPNRIRPMTHKTTEGTTT